MSIPAKYTDAEMTYELTRIVPAFIAVAYENNLRPERVKIDPEALLLDFVGEEATAEQVAIAMQHAVLNIS